MYEKPSEPSKQYAKKKAELHRHELDRPTPPSVAAHKIKTIIWETVAHELAFVIHQLEENPKDIKAWKKVWRALSVYENACKRDGK